LLSIQHDRVTTAEMSNSIILYDIPSKLPGKYKPWSPYTWSARYALNFKELSYKTEWVDFPDIEAVCLKIGAAATRTKTSDGSPLYTLPVIYDSSTQSVISDSFKIALYLDKQYPDKPKLFPHSTQALVFGAKETVFPIMPKIHCLVAADASKMMTERSLGYYLEINARSFAPKKLEEVAPKGSDEEEELWKQLGAEMQKIGEWVDLTKGPYVMGETVSFADFVLAAALMWARRAWSAGCGGGGESSKEWERVCNIDGGRWKRFMMLLEEYEQVV